MDSFFHVTILHQWNKTKGGAGLLLVCSIEPSKNRSDGANFDTWNIQKIGWPHLLLTCMIKSPGFAAIAKHLLRSDLSSLFKAQSLPHLTVRCPNTKIPPKFSPLIPLVAYFIFQNFKYY